MADPDRNPTAPVNLPPGLEAFLNDPTGHDFFAIMRWLQARLDMPAIGTAISPAQERVRLAHEPSLAFAPAAIAGAGWNPEKSRLDLRLSFTGLLGPNGPMPIHLTEHVLDRRNHHGDRTMEMFLNIFHHRIYTLFFRAWALNQRTVDFESAGGRHGHYLRCLIGRGTGGAENRDNVSDDARIYYSGWLGNLSRKPAGLAAILADFLRMPVTVHSFQAMWLDLPHDSQCRLGESRATGLLGVSCFAGERIRVSHLKFRIRIGPLDRTNYENLLPTGPAFRQVGEWVRSLVGEELFCEVQLVLRREDVPPCRLGGGVHLGWTTWLGQPDADRDVDDLVAQVA
ncbi:MAG TPA: type VI secretion system baseplate subunit TssG [Lacunisphaera sp.]|nr:type VI secretion system baseplate subunit TssG [Lacunisphaera sp.]